MDVLTGKGAIVTGGTSGLGVRIAERFVEEGAEMVIAGRRCDKSAEVAARLGPRASFARTDVSVEAEVHAMVEHALDRFGRLDCLVNNAGSAGTLGGGARHRPCRFRAHHGVHVWGVLAGMKHAASVLMAQGSGSIVNAGSSPAFPRSRAPSAFDGSR